MNPLIRISLVIAAMSGSWLIARAMWPAVSSNLMARRSWTRTEGEVRGLAGDVEFELGSEPETYRATTKVDHNWGLTLFHKAPLWMDPADQTRIKTAGFLQMWLAPAALGGMMLLLLATALFAALAGTGPVIATADGMPRHARWQFTTSPGALNTLGEGINLHSPDKQWKIVVGWSMLGVAMVTLVALGKGGHLVSSAWYMIVGSAFTISLWMFACHTKTLEVSANGQGMRMTSALGWREVPWAMVRGVEEQEIFTTYYNGNMKMWELPFPGSTVHVISFNDAGGRTLMSFSPELGPGEEQKRLFEMCAARTGAHLKKRTIAIKY